MHENGQITVRLAAHFTREPTQYPIGKLSGGVEGGGEATKLAKEWATQKCGKKWPNLALGGIADSMTNCKGVGNLPEQEPPSGDLSPSFV